jgi:hypothetical protein
MIDFEDAETESVTIELRYPQALPLWDDSGKIWTRLRDSFPELKLNTAVPQQQIFESAQLRMVVELEAFRVTARNPKAEIRVAEAAQEMLETCSKYLHLSAFSRLGLRSIKVIKAPSSQDATAEALKMLPHHLPDSVAKSSKVMTFNASLRHETETLGLLASIRGEERELKAVFPWEVSYRLTPALTKQMEKEYVIVFDSDYFTVGTTERESLDITEWARQADRYIKKYWQGVLK